MNEAILSVAVYVENDFWLILYNNNNNNSFLILVCEAIGSAAASWPIVPASGDIEDDCGETDEM
jgi:hypothetical protein